MEAGAKRGESRDVRVLATALAGLGRVPEAINVLERAAGAGGDAFLWSDLSAAYLSVGDAASDLKGLDASVRAYQVSSKVPEVLFNYASALDAHGLRTASAEVWHRYSLRAGSKEDMRAGGADEPLPGRDDGLAQRRQVEAALTLWARSASSAEFARACGLADAHSRAYDDHFLPDICADARAFTGPAFASGWTALTRAREQSDALTFESARESAAQALRHFAANSQAGLAAAGYQMAVIEYQTGAIDQSAQRIEALLPRLKERRWRQLYARTEWLRGIVDETRGHPAAALSRFKIASEELGRLNEPENELAVRSLSAYMLQLLGDFDGSWRAHHEVLQASSRVQHLHRRQAVFLTAGLAANALGYQGAASRLLDEYVAAARSLGAAPALAEAYLNRLNTVGRGWPPREQLDEIRRIEDIAQNIANPDRRAFVLARSALHHARLAAPREALILAGGAVEHIRQSGRLFLMPEAMLRTAESHLAQGDTAAAERSILQGISAFQEQLESAAATPYRVSYLDTGFLLYETLLDLLMNANRTDEAFMWFDRARALGFAGRPAVTKALRVRDLQLQLGADTSALVYMKTRDRLRIWHITSQRVNVAESPLSVKDLEALIGEWRGGSNGAGLNRQDEDRIAASLFKALVQPVGTPPAGRLVIVADAPVHGVPFAALRDGQGRLLVETVAVSMTPSIGQALDSFRLGIPKSVVAVGAPPVDVSTYGFLPNLPFANREAGEIGAMYPVRRLLTGSNASKQAIAASLREADVVHFATHAVIHRDDATLSYLLVAPDANGDGRLTAREIGGMSWSKPSVVVLAACSTSAGPESRSQGPLGLSRVLLESGVPRVIATLWDIDDRVSHELFTTFHRQIRAGVDPIEALRTAQLQLAGAHPASEWGAFTVYATRLGTGANAGGQR